MPFVGVRELKTKASEILKVLRQEKKDFIVTYKGKPFAVLAPLTEEELEDYILASHPRFIEMRIVSREEIKKGETADTEELKRLAKEVKK